MLKSQKSSNREIPALEGGVRYSPLEFFWRLAIGVCDFGRGKN
jgi:hypothetical protein